MTTKKVQTTRKIKLKTESEFILSIKRAITESKSLSAAYQVSPPFICMRYGKFNFLWINFRSVNFGEPLLNNMRNDTKIERTYAKIEGNT